jgi:putative membrane protein
LLEKRGLAGMKVVAYSSVITYSIFLMLGLLLKNQIMSIYFFVKDYVWVLLAGISLHLIIKEKSIRKAALFFGLSGLLGLFSFNSGINDPFLPLLTGLFGLSSLVEFKNKKERVPAQMKRVVIRSSFSEIIKASLIGLIGSIIMAIVPSMSPSQVGLLTEEFKKTKTSDELKVAGMTSINISDNILSLIALVSINKSRSGVIEKISSLISLNLDNYYLLLFTGFIACVISSWLLIEAARIASNKADWFNNKKLKVSIIIFVSLMTLLIDGFIGLIILALATTLGYYCIKKDVRRSQLLGCLVIPTIIFYLSIIL